MPPVRRLTAILAADVAGYSRLMGADEEGTHERLKAHLRELVDPKIREHHGRIVKTTGDGVLAEFASVVDAVRCAGEIQRAMANRDLDLAEERRLRFRIGVNLGDVIADGGDIYGDGVNIAARLEALAAPGSICVSGTVRDHIGDRLPYAFDDMGEQRNAAGNLTGTEGSSQKTLRWREQDSNHRSLSGTLPGPAHARLPNAARTPCLGAVAQELPLHRVHLGDICRDVVVTAAFAGD